MSLSRATALLSALLLSSSIQQHPAASSGSLQEPAVTKAKPNLLILVADDLGYADLGCQGSTEIPTPNIDSIAAKGLRFTDGYVTGCVCSPTRAALLTSRYQQRYGLDAVADLSTVSGLNTNELTLAERLRPSGYVSGMFGKWHLGGGADQLPEAQGFDEFCYGEPLNHSGSPLSIRRAAAEPILSERSIDNITTILGREVPAFVVRNQAKPWFAYVAFKAPHMPQQPPAGYADRFAHIQDKDRRLYCASVAAQDDTVGLILDALRKSGQEERTLVIYLSDNGGAGFVRRSGGKLGAGESLGSLNAKGESKSNNDPLRGHKGTLWEGGIRVPMLMQWPGVLPAGGLYERPITQMDFGVTFLALAGVADGSAEMDGVNVWPFLTGNAGRDPHDSLFWTYLGGQTAVRSGDWKLVRSKDGGDEAHLYHLLNDVGETKDLAAEHPEKVKELEQQLAAWLTAVGLTSESDAGSGG